MPVMSEASFDALRHIEVHGPRSRAEITGGLKISAREASYMLENLSAGGYVAKDHTTTPMSFALTNKGRKRLAIPNEPPAPRGPMPKKEREADAAAMSAAQAARTTQRMAVRIAHLFARRVSGVGMGNLTAPYCATEYNPSSRRGATDALKLPSRVGDSLHWRDGRVTDMDGNPLS